MRGAGERAGPDPYADECDTCSQHLGYLIGHQTDAKRPEEIYWEVETWEMWRGQNVAIDPA